MAKKKVLLMGKSGAGKTSMRSIIFANYMARDTMRLAPTLDVEHTNVRFLGNLVLNLWDCGGQFRFFESYFESDTIFRNVEVLIYVFDIDSSDLSNDITLFVGILDALERCSPDASIFILIHKMDLVAEEDREQEFNERVALVQSKSEHFTMQCFATSIWDETLYRAWSRIVYSLIPNVELLERQLKDFSMICGADEIVLFERATFLVISHASSLDSTQYDSHRFERISNIIKQFKISCSKTQSQFQVLNTEVMYG
jgi:Ras-related GTP-binding protein A/B